MAAIRPRMGVRIVLKSAESAVTYLQQAPESQG